VEWNEKARTITIVAIIPYPLHARHLACITSFNPYTHLAGKVLLVPLYRTDSQVKYLLKNT
jgi:hypothetical protein